MLDGRNQGESTQAVRMNEEQHQCEGEKMKVLVNPNVCQAPGLVLATAAAGPLGIATPCFLLTAPPGPIFLPLGSQTLNNSWHTIPQATSCETNLAGNMQELEPNIFTLGIWPSAPQVVDVASDVVELKGNVLPSSSSCLKDNSDVVQEPEPEPSPPVQQLAADAVAAASADHHGAVDNDDFEHHVEHNSKIRSSVPPPKKKRRTRKIWNDGKPLRPRTAYNFFYKEERQRLLAATEEENGSGDLKVPLEVMTKSIASRWKELQKDPSNGEIVRYTNMAAQDKERYANELEKYKHQEQERLTDFVAKQGEAVDDETWRRYLASREGRP